MEWLKERPSVSSLTASAISYHHVLRHWNFLETRNRPTALQYVLHNSLQVTDRNINIAQFLDDNLYSGHLDNICLQRAKFNGIFSTYIISWANQCVVKIITSETDAIVSPL
jgi:hypothetical protein